MCVWFYTVRYYKYLSTTPWMWGFYMQLLFRPHQTLIRLGIRSLLFSYRKRNAVKWHKGWEIQIRQQHEQEHQLGKKYLIGKIRFSLHNVTHKRAFPSHVHTHINTSSDIQCVCTAVHTEEKAIRHMTAKAHIQVDTHKHAKSTPFTPFFCL